PATIFMAVLAVPILIVYPFAKRWMHCPQAILGLAFSFGILMAYSSILGEHVSWWKIFMSLPPTAWLLFMANFAWILAYDTIYALVDIEDDKKIGIRTSAIFFGRMVRSVIGVFYLIYLILSAWILLQFNNSFLSWIVLGLMGWQIVNFWLKIKSLDRLICLQVFSQNYRLGWLFFAGVILQKTSMLNHIG
ncbi:MAG: UbiA family prenyltransferase, partial [Gammaproteobacteria bacterium]|nr:UbiA family prenyltransferase [Gammaproteobacteria bacterium]